MILLNKKGTRPTEKWGVENTLNKIIGKKYNFNYWFWKNIYFWQLEKNHNANNLAYWVKQ